MSAPNEWGPSAWKFLHAITFAYPESPTLLDIENARLFFNSLPGILPCENCRQHFANEITISPPNLSSKTALSHWLVDIHNKVNERLGKPIYKYEAVAKSFGNQCTGCKSREVNSDVGIQAGYTILAILIVSVVLLTLIYRRYV